MYTSFALIWYECDINEVDTRKSLGDKWDRTCKIVCLKMVYARLLHL